MSRIKRCVSLYSLQYQYMTGEMSLEAIFNYMKELGVEGIELLPDQMLHGTPEPTDETLKMWDQLREKYDIGLACDDIFLNTNLYKNRTLTKRECISLIKKEIVMANRLGFRAVRLVSMIPAWVLEPCLETAEKNDVSMSIEIHGGLGFGVAKTEEFLAEMVRLDSPYIGIVPDSSIFCRKAPRVVDNYCRKLFGTNEELIAFADEVYESGKDMYAFGDGSLFAEGIEAGLKRNPELKKLVKDPAKDAFYLQNLSGYENKPLSVMDPYVKYIKHVHLKTYEALEDGSEYSMPHREILEYLHKHGYDGYVATEYEGNRWTLPGEPLKEKEQVKLHQGYLEKCLKEIQG